MKFALAQALEELREEIDPTDYWSLSSPTKIVRKATALLRIYRKRTERELEEEADERAAVEIAELEAALAVEDKPRRAPGPNQ
jgi:hypothetical protein